MTIMISVPSDDAKAIFEGEKTWELRKVYPNQIKLPSSVMVYAPKPVGCVLGFFATTKIVAWTAKEWIDYGEQLCWTQEQIADYLQGKVGYGINIVNPRRIEPIPLEKLIKLGIKPPQLYTYLSRREVLGILR